MRLRLRDHVTGTGGCALRESENREKTQICAFPSARTAAAGGPSPGDGVRERLVWTCVSLCSVPSCFRAAS